MTYSKMSIQITILKTRSTRLVQPGPVWGIVSGCSLLGTLRRVFSKNPLTASSTYHPIQCWTDWPNLRYWVAKWWAKTCLSCAFKEEKGSFFLGWGAMWLWDFVSLESWRLHGLIWIKYYCHKCSWRLLLTKFCIAFLIKQAFGLLFICFHKGHTP